MQSARVRTQQPLSNDERRRIRAERARKKRRRRNMIVAAVLTAVVLVVGIVLCLTVFFNIAAITVDGDEIYNAQQIVEASGLRVGENMFLMSAKKTAAQIEKNLPYIEKAEIKRSLSCTVTVTVHRAQAVAALESEDTYILLNASGKVLEDGVFTLADSLLILNAGAVHSAVPGESVEFASPESLQTFSAVYQALCDAQITGITALDIENPMLVTARYQDRILLKLGEASAIPEKTNFIRATLERCEKNTPNFRGTIDFTIDKKAYQNAETQAETAPESTTALQENAIKENAAKPAA